MQRRFNLTSVFCFNPDPQIMAVRGGDATAVTDVRKRHLFTRPGFSMTRYTSGSAKVILSRFTENNIDTFLERVPLKRFTSKTIPVRERQPGTLSMIRQGGCAAGDEGMGMGIRCKAASVFDHPKILMAPVSATGATVRVMAEKINYDSGIAKAFCQHDIEQSRLHNVNQKGSNSWHK